MYPPNGRKKTDWWFSQHRAGLPNPLLCTTEEFLSDYTSSFIFRKAKFFLNTHLVAKRLTKSGNHTIIGLFRYLQGTRFIYLSFYNMRLYNDV